MADQLTLYNDALGHLKERVLASLTENREPRRVLDAYWTDSVNYCLGQGLWLFAKRSVAVTPSTTLIPTFSWLYAFDIPEDWVRTIGISIDPFFAIPLDFYSEEAGVWYANSQPLYVQYVSNDPTYGWNLGAWPESFSEYVAMRLAVKACKRITRDEALFESLKKEEKYYRIDARGKDAMNAAVGIRPMGTWVRSRYGAVGGGLFTPGTLAMGPDGDDF